MSKLKELVLKTEREYMKDPFNILKRHKWFNAMHKYEDEQNHHKP